MMGGSEGRVEALEVEVVALRKALHEVAVKRYRKTVERDHRDHEVNAVRCLLCRGASFRWNVEPEEFHVEGCLLR